MLKLMVIIEKVNCDVFWVKNLPTGFHEALTELERSQAL